MQGHGRESGSGAGDQGDRGGAICRHRRGRRGAGIRAGRGSVIVDRRSANQHYGVPRQPLASPNKTSRSVRETATDVDPRTERTTRALGHALVELMQEREFDSITVQQILDRADVGRTSFYAHFRNKQDVFDSSFEHLFTLLEPLLDRPGVAGRLFPVREFSAHLADAEGLIDAMRRDGQMEDMWSQCVGYMADIIERRLPPSIPDGSSRKLQARMLAEAVRWSLDRPGSTTPNSSTRSSMRSRAHCSRRHDDRADRAAPIPPGQCARRRRASHRVVHAGRAGLE